MGKLCARTKNRWMALLAGLLVLAMTVVGCGSKPAEQEASKATEQPKEATTEESETPQESTAEGNNLDPEYWKSLAPDDQITWKAPENPSHNIGLLVPDLSNEFYNGIATTAEQIFKDAGYQMNTVGLNNGTEAGVNAIETWTDQGVDAIIIMAQDNTCDQALKAAMEKGILVVSASAEIEYYHHWLTQDNYDVGYQTAAACADWVKENLEDKINYIVCLNDATEATADKGRGVKEGMKELLPGSTCVGEVGFTSTDQVYADIQTLLGQYPDTACIVGMHNSFALIGLEAAKAAGVAKKGQFGVFGSALSDQVLAYLADDNSCYEAEVWMGDQGKNFAEHTLGLLNGNTYTHHYKALNYIITHDNLETYYEDYYKLADEQ